MHSYALGSADRRGRQGGLPGSDAMVNASSARTEPPFWTTVNVPVLTTQVDISGRSAGVGGYGSFSNTATWLWLPEVNGARSQPAQRSRTRKPPILAIRSSSDGHT